MPAIVTPELIEHVIGFQIRRHVTQIVTEEQEAAMVAKHAFALAILGITPLIAFLIIYYFFPDLLLFLDPPSK